MAYKTAQDIYSRLRILKNLALNRFDPPVVVLIYHRVTVLPADPQLLAVAPDNFRAQLRHLKDHYPVLRFEEDWSQTRQPAVVITFDDGYADNALEALPILEEVGVPATFFVSTGSLGSRLEFWWDELERVILGEWRFAPLFVLDDERLGRSWPTGTAAERRTLYHEIHPLMKQAQAPTRRNWLAQLRQWARVGEEGREAYRPMTVDELRRLADSKWATIGAHTVTHCSLSSLPVVSQREEVNLSKRRLEAELGREVTVFSYPFGKKSDYTGDSVRICREAGFAKAASNFPGQAHSWSDPFQLPRQLVRNWGQAEFAEMLRKFWA